MKQRGVSEEALEHGQRAEGALLLVRESAKNVAQCGVITALSCPRRPDLVLCSLRHILGEPRTVLTSPTEEDTSSSDNFLSASEVSEGEDAV